MPSTTVSSDTERGNRLEKFLKDLLPETSWRARSNAIGFPDSTVIGWRKGREISGEGLAKLHQLGCDLYWLLTGDRNASSISPEAGRARSVTRLVTQCLLLQEQLAVLTRNLLESGLSENAPVHTGLTATLQRIQGAIKQLKASLQVQGLDKDVS